MPFYHVRITPASSPSREEVRVDLSRDELMERFVIPYLKGNTLVISGRSLPSNEIQRIRISKSDQDSKRLGEATRAERRSSPGNSIGSPSIEWVVASGAEEVTDEFITAPPGSYLEPTNESETEPNPRTEIKPSADAREVFVVHGRNHAARDALFQFLRSVDLHPLEWNEAVRSTGKASPYIGEILDAAFSRAHAVVVLFTPDDEARLRQEFRVRGDPPHETQLYGQARPNVLFEAGMAISRSEERTVLVEIGVLKPFSDVGGRHAIRFDGSTPRRQELAQRLQTAGCPVNLSGTDWHSAGDFNSVVNVLLSEDPMEPTPI